MAAVGSNIIRYKAKEVKIMVYYNISEQYSNTLGARYAKDCAFSGEDFRNTVLVPFYLSYKANGQTVKFVLDGTYGYPISFLEEAFGGLARVYPGEDVMGMIEGFISTDQPSLPKTIEHFIRTAHDIEAQ